MPVKTGIQNFSLDSRFLRNRSGRNEPEQSITREDPISLVFHRNEKPIKAISLFSGGLDSIVSVQLIREQGIEVLGLTFRTPSSGR